jgi:ATP-binding cassette subfamily D (ALD) long-chain fatty acid import protein
MTEDFVIKYFWSAAGYGLMSIPLLFGKKAAATRGDTTSSMVASRTESEDHRNTYAGKAC